MSVNVQNGKNNLIELIDSDLTTLSLPKKQTTLIVKPLRIGGFIRYGDKIGAKIFTIKSGQILYIDAHKMIIRNASPFLVTSQGILKIHHNELVEEGVCLFSFLYQQVKTGDIVQGIPRIEEFFESRAIYEGISVYNDLHNLLKKLFNRYLFNFNALEATQKSFEVIQRIIVEEIQKVYCSQGVQISDKHLEIIVRQMTARVQIIDGGSTGLLVGELIEFQWIRLIGKNSQIKYKPVLLGITKASLETDSFISAASFQETTRILSKAAIQKKVDFIRGLKQNVIIGNLIPAGTGFLPSALFKFLNLEQKFKCLFK